MGINTEKLHAHMTTTDRDQNNRHLKPNINVGIERERLFVL